MAVLDVIGRIRQFNQGRDPDRLALKYELMRQNAFAFLRGTYHLFYERLPRAPVFRQAPVTWVCGDLHFQNFGSYKGDDRLVFFDMNDFDEAALAPCTWDLVRFLASILVGARTGLARSTIYHHNKAGTFPRSIPLGPRAVGWLESDVSNWIAERVQMAWDSTNRSV